MGHTIWIELKGKSRPKGDKGNDNSIILQLEKNLDGIASKIGVRKPSEFYDYTELDDYYDATEIGPKLKANWSNSVQGLDSLFAILAELLGNPKALRFKPDSSTEHWPGQL